jgi:hypothetical protein
MKIYSKCDIIVRGQPGVYRKAYKPLASINCKNYAFINISHGKPDLKQQA